ncbi:MAG: epoxide hydrolase N-terminal domain-containing protein, partial [Micrococcales bacterium]|nr:epoxide hydrolase N-terminal domain-containing protein [Micrococcales bacterium]
MPKLSALSASPTISQAAIDDLHRRLDRVRWPHRATGAAVPGFDTDRLRPLVERWRHSFDWRTVEARLERIGRSSPGWWCNGACSFRRGSG